MKFELDFAPAIRGLNLVGRCGGVSPEVLRCARSRKIAGETPALRIPCKETKSPERISPGSQKK
jgi:hypothetical protein